jgi:hypothetical protein
MPCVVLDAPHAWTDASTRGFTFHSIGDVRWARRARLLYVVQPHYHDCAPVFSLQAVAVCATSSSSASPWVVLRLVDRQEGVGKDGSITSAYEVPDAFDGSDALQVLPTVNDVARTPQTVRPLPEPVSGRSLLGLTTLFLYDHALLERYVDYYHRAHQVDVFLLFYNGWLSDDPTIQTRTERYLSTFAARAPTILLSSWPFPYWQTFCQCNPSEGVWHGAQGLQVALASIVASRWCEWLLHADLDEYVAYEDGRALSSVLRTMDGADDRALVFRNTFVPCGGFFCQQRDFPHGLLRTRVDVTRWWTRVPVYLKDLVWRLPAGPLDDRSKYVQRTSSALQRRGIHMPSTNPSEVSPEEARLIQMVCWSGRRFCPGDARLAALMHNVYSRNE